MELYKVYKNLMNLIVVLSFVDNTCKGCYTKTNKVNEIIYKNSYKVHIKHNIIFFT